MRKVLILLGLLLMGGGIAFLYKGYGSPHPIRVSRFILPAGESQLLTLKRLQQEGHLRLGWFYSLLSRLALLPPFRHGVYRFPERASDEEILFKLIRGEVEMKRVTFPEGITAEEMARILEEAEVTSAQAFLEVIRSPSFLKRFSIPATEAEGYLFPETYLFPVSSAAEKVAEKLVRTFFARLPPDYAQRAQKVRLTLHEAVILASLIQKESYLPEEMALISAVFHNRLRRKMRLQADPSAIYRMPGYQGNLTRKHLTTYTPYNTYVIFGLPRGPIGNPGTAALLSAVSPAPVSYLYFVSRGDGTHVFSTNYKEHNRYVELYQKRHKPLQ